MNKVSKSTFLKYLRCPRAAYFENQTSTLVRDYKKDLAMESDEEKITLMKEEFNAKILEYMSEGRDTSTAEEGEENDEDLSMLHLLKEDKLLALMQDTYFQIEQLSAQRAYNLFGGTIQAGQRHDDQIVGQKILNLFEDGFNFFTFTDVVQEDEHCIRLIETKATTSKKFIDLAYQYKKESYPFFIETADGNLMLKELFPGEELHDAYYKKRQKLFDRVGDHGRYVYDLAWQRYLLENGSQRPEKPVCYYLAVLNTNYVFDGQTDEHGKAIYNANDVITLIDLTKITEEWQAIIAKDFATVKQRILEASGDVVSLEKSKCLYGKGFRECPWLSKCKQDKHVPDKNSVFTYIDGFRGFLIPGTKDRYSIEELIDRGITQALDVNYEWLTAKQKIQYRVLESKEAYVDKEFIARKLNDLKYPLYHLDFETMNAPLPLFKGEKPYQQSVFQFSLHIERQPGVCDKEQDQIAYLASGSKDEREALVKALIKAIPNDGKGEVVAYNQGFEKGRMKELAKIFPQYAQALMSIVNRTMDLMHFIKPSKDIIEAYYGDKEAIPGISYYHEYLQRSYSIKKVLPIFAPHLDYSRLMEVHNGTEAQLAYLRLSSLSGEQFNQTYENMLEYCKQDTWAMVEILKALRKLV